MEKPKSATAVIATLNAVTFAVPKRRVMRSLSKLETMVPAEIVMEMGPADGIRYFDVEYDVTGLVETIKARSTDVSKARVIEESKKFNEKISMGNKAKKLIKKSEKIYVDPTITSKEEAQYRVESLMEEMSYRFGSLECDCIGMPELMPGKFLVLKSLGEPVENKFYLVKVVHRINDEGGFETTVYGKANGIEESLLG